MDYTLPSHWQELPAKTKSYDSGRDYTKPMYIRVDNFARIYHNVVKNEYDKQFEFAIVSANGDGDCAPSLEEAIKAIDKYIEKYPEQFVESIRNLRRELF